ncbi:hypothetical protein [Kocuria sp. CCUG 69068]|uniref:hypothetical protein n=1 Tax=Kocuria sp. CCUG 69068 TaxID=2043138 RepID=UPI001E4EE86F
MTDIDLTPMNEATARALFAEDLAEQCIRRQPQESAEKAAAARIWLREYALNRWDTGTVNQDTVYRYRELALAATLTTWKDVARQAWDHCADQLDASSGLMNASELKDANPYGEGTR